MIPLGRKCNSEIFCVHGSISEYTFSSRNRLVIRCEYWDLLSFVVSHGLLQEREFAYPKSRTRMVSNVSAGTLTEAPSTSPLTAIASCSSANGPRERIQRSAYGSGGHYECATRGARNNFCGAEEGI